MRLSSVHQKATQQNPKTHGSLVIVVVSCNVAVKTRQAEGLLEDLNSESEYTWCESIRYNTEEKATNTLLNSD